MTRHTSEPTSTGRDVALPHGMRPCHARAFRALAFPAIFLAATRASCARSSREAPLVVVR